MGEDKSKAPSEQATAEAKAKAELAASEAKAKAELVAAAPKVKMIKIRALTAIAPHGTILEAGAEVEVDEPTAKEFCDRVYKGNLSFGGERGHGAEGDRHMVKRAERV